MIVTSEASFLDTKYSVSGKNDLNYSDQYFVRKKDAFLET